MYKYRNNKLNYIDHLDTFKHFNLGASQTSEKRLGRNAMKHVEIGHRSGPKISFHFLVQFSISFIISKL